MSITVEQLVKEKRKLQEDLAIIVQSRLNRFQTDTGSTPRSISVNMIRLNFVGDPDTKHAVGSVVTELFLD